MSNTLEVDMRTVADLDKSIEQLALLSGRSMDAVIKSASVRATRSAAVATPRAKLNRPSSRAKGRAGGAGFGSKAGRLMKGVPWWAIGMVEIWSKGIVRQQFFRKMHTYEKARKTPRRGLGKNVWIARAHQFKRTNVANQTLSNAYGRTLVRKKGNRIDSVEMSNSLNYIRKVAPNSARIAVHKTDKWIQGFALKQLERKMLRQFARGTAAIRGF